MSEPGTPNASPTVDTLRRSLESPSAVFSSPRRAIVYSDRYIPSRATSSRLDFSMLDRERDAQKSPIQQEREDANPAYKNMLRQTLLGCGLARPRQLRSRAVAPRQERLAIKDCALGCCNAQEHRRLLPLMQFRDALQVLRLARISRLG